MRKETRESIVAFSSIILSVVIAVCAGFWTLYTYYGNLKKVESERIFKISGEIQAMNFYSVQGEDGHENYLKTLLNLKSMATYWYSEIKKPESVPETKWHDKWKNFYASVKKAIRRPFDKMKPRQDINKHWIEILQMKEIQILDE